MFVIWDFEHLCHPALANVSSRSLEEISGTPLCKQEFALWEATAGMGLQVQVCSYTGRQALAWKYECLIPPERNVLSFWKKVRHKMHHIFDNEAENKI